MEYLQNGFTLELGPGSFPLSTDSIALADFVRLPKNAKVLDLCAGCATLGLMLCAKDEGCTVTGIEINESDHLMALENSRRNGLQQRLTSICGDIKDGAPGQFDIVISNPPYYSGGPQSKATPTARRTDLCPLETVVKSAAKALKFGGDFYIVHKPEMLGTLCALGGKYNLEAKELLLLRHSEQKPISLVLMKFRKGAKAGVVITEQFLHQQDGQPSAYYKSIYHLGE